MTFTPLSVITSEARESQDKYLSSIQARIDSGNYPPGLRKQYELQLDHIKAQIPSCEFILIPAYSPFSRERERDGLAYSGLLTPTS